MVATRLSCGVVNQVKYMSDPRFEVLYIPEWGCTSKISVYLIAVPSYLGDKLCSYLQNYRCKFQQRWSIQRLNRCEFFVEEIPSQVLDAICVRTLANQGKVNLGAIKLTSPNAVGIEVDLVPCSSTNERALTIKVNGEDIPASGDDMDDHEWWLAHPNLDLKLKTAVEMAVNSRSNIVFYYDTRINLNLRELLESCGFKYSPDEESMRLSS
jgi:hypothetical protein